MEETKEVAVPPSLQNNLATEERKRKNQEVCCGKHSSKPTRTQAIMNQGHQVVVTTDTEAALDALRHMDARTLLVDNELRYGSRRLICMTMVSQDHEEAVIFHGPYVNEDAHQIYKLLAGNGTTCVCWDSNCERDYPNLVDAQRQLYETTG